MEELNYRELISGIGIEKGNILDIASGLHDIKQYCRSHNMSFDGNHLIDVLKEETGPGGTVMIRAFTWDFCQQIPFDILHSPSQVGALGNIAMEREDFKRTQHPIYSWMVWGKYQEYLCDLENKNAFGAGTPFDFLYQKNAKNVRLGNLKAWAFTQRHHAEKVAEVPFRYEKIFEGEYTDEKGNCTKRQYSMYVRRLEFEVDLSDYSAVEHEWERAGIKTEKTWNGIHFSSVNIKEAMDDIYEDLISNFGRKTIIINGKSGYEGIG